MVDELGSGKKEHEEEWVPHEEEGHGRPEDVTAVVQEDAGYHISPNITTRKNTVEEEKETYLKTFFEIIHHLKNSNVNISGGNSNAHKLACLFTTVHIKAST